jgi:hypothetical protein
MFERKRFHINFFTLLELILSILILSIVAATATVVLRAVIDSYNRSSTFAEFTQTLGGCSMILRNDIGNIVPIKDEKNIFFYKKSFSFVSKTLDNSGKLSFKLVRYVYDRGILYRGMTEYPDYRARIDKNLSEFMVNINDFKILYNNTFVDYENTAVYNERVRELAIDSVSDDAQSDSSGVPKLIELVGTVSNGSYINPFDISVCIPYYGTVGDSEEKDTAGKNTEEPT